MSVRENPAARAGTTPGRRQAAAIGASMGNGRRLRGPGRWALFVAALGAVLAMFLPATGASAMPAAPSRLSVTSLQADYASDPLGIDDPHPGLSWQLRSAMNGERQTAYRILVASTPDRLAPGRADVCGQRQGHLQRLRRRALRRPGAAAGPALLLDRPGLGRPGQPIRMGAVRVVGDGSAHRSQLAGSAVDQPGHRRAGRVVRLCPRRGLHHPQGCGEHRVPGPGSRQPLHVAGELRGRSGPRYAPPASGGQRILQATSYPTSTSAR